MLLEWHSAPNMQTKDAKVQDVRHADRQYMYRILC